MGRVRTEVSVGPETRFTEGKFVIVQVGERSIGIIRLRTGELRAVRNRCPHKGAPICRGIVGGTWPPSAPGELQFERDGEVLVCPWHGFEYGLDDGIELYRETPSRLLLYSVVVREGAVFVSV